MGRLEEMSTEHGNQHVILMNTNFFATFMDSLFFLSLSSRQQPLAILLPTFN